MDAIDGSITMLHCLCDERVSTRDCGHRVKQGQARSSRMLLNQWFNELYGIMSAKSTMRFVVDSQLRGLLFGPIGFSCG